MKPLSTVLAGIAVLASAALPVATGAAASELRSAMSVSIVAPTTQVTISSGKPVMVHVKITGLTLDLIHVGKKNIAGHGHMQLYLDSIPSDAYVKADRKNVVADIAVTPIAFQVSKSWAKLHRGSHRLIVALAKNNNVLYHAPTATVAAIVK